MLTSPRIRGLKMYSCTTLARGSTQNEAIECVRCKSSPVASSNLIFTCKCQSSFDQPLIIILMKDLSSNYIFSVVLAVVLPQHLILYILSAFSDYMHTYKNISYI